MGYNPSLFINRPPPSQNVNATTTMLLLAILLTNNPDVRSKNRAYTMFVTYHGTETGRKAMNRKAKGIDRDLGVL
jgi:hypothetical protein